MKDQISLFTVDIAASLHVDGGVAEGTVLAHGDVLLVGAVVAGAAAPHRALVHQRPPRHDTRGELGPCTYRYTYRVSQKKGDLERHDHNSSEIHQKGKELVCFGKFSLYVAGQAPNLSNLAKKNELEVGNSP